MWAVCAFCIILSTYNLVVTIIGCCACCNMDKIKEAPATSAGIYGASPVAVIVNPMPVLTMAVPVTVPVSQRLAQAWWFFVLIASSCLFVFRRISRCK
jgi:hypothetical protein